MNNKLRIIGFSFLVIITFNHKSINAQTTDQLVDMVKNMLQQFGEFIAEDVESDEVKKSSASFDPGIQLNNEDIYTTVLKDPGKMFSLTDYQSWYTLLDEKEYPVNSINLVFSFVSLPAFSTLNAWFDLASIKDSKGKNLLLSEKQIEKYREYGIIDDDFNYHVPGEFSLNQWLSRELEDGEELHINGSVGLEYPGDYSSIVFGKDDIGESKSVGNTGIKLLDIDRNMVTLIVKGDRNNIEGLQIMLLNTQGKTFTATSSMAIDAKMYDVESKSVRELSDEEITASVENFDISNMETEQVKRIKVFGNIDKVVFMKIGSMEYLDTSFSLSLPFNY